ncbi:MAG: hypothetical protein E6J27_04675 [Chloroflexi bacterium]|nr:MAG: hypothetical protein E6J27_04675 [Chloroflexota bacterium]TMC35986.1 MAG: hypothetical protein E6J24_03015 [Chloroflexota bacterium]
MDSKAIAAAIHGEGETLDDIIAELRRSDREVVFEALRGLIHYSDADVPGWLPWAAPKFPGGSAVAHAVASGLATNTSAGVAGFGIEKWLEEGWNQPVDDLHNAMRP